MLPRRGGMCSTSWSGLRFGQREGGIPAQGRGMSDRSIQALLLLRLLNSTKPRKDLRLVRIVDLAFLIVNTMAGFSGGYWVEPINWCIAQPKQGRRTVRWRKQ